jgi:hypothetical protein
MSKTFSANDVASHKTPDSLWIIVDQDVYDLTKFQDDHPGKTTGITVPCSAARRLHYHHHVAFAAAQELPILTQSSSHRWQEDPAKSGRKGCLQAVLEVPQRGYSEEVPEATPGRQPRHQAQGRGEACSRADARGRPQVSSRQEARRTQGRGGSRGSGAVWRADSIRRPKLVPRGQ